MSADRRMISRRKRPFPRRQFERELRAGKTSFLHEPRNMAARDYVLHRANLNPFRSGTEDAREYDAAYAHVEKELNDAWKNQTSDASPNQNPGSATS